MKLTNAQRKVMDKARQDIDFARNHTLREWVIKQIGWQDEHYIALRIQNDSVSFGGDSEKLRTYIENQINLGVERLGKRYEEEKQGIVDVHCAGGTLEKLAKLGLIEIIYNSTGSKGWCMDKVKILNY